jgi:hypothetical protein
VHLPRFGDILIWIRNPRWEQKRTEGCVIISSKYAEQNEQLFTDVLCHVHYNALDNLKKEKECFV